MLDIFKNSWFIGIITGVISGIFVYFVTNIIAKKKGKEDYIRQLDAANNSVIDILKPYISEQGLPNSIALEALMNAMSRKYKVSVKDMYSPNMVIEELIKEIMSDIYVSADKKKEYINELTQYNISLNSSIEEETVGKKNSFTNSHYSWATKVVSIYTSFLAGSVTIIATMTSYRDKSFWYPFDNNPMIWAIIIIIMMIVMLFISFKLVELKRRHYIFNKEGNNKKTDIKGK